MHSCYLARERHKNNICLIDDAYQILNNCFTFHKKMKWNVCSAFKFEEVTDPNP